MTNSVNSFIASLLFLLIGFNSNIISLFFDIGNGIFKIRLFSFSFIIILLLRILSLISSNVSFKISNCKKYLFSRIFSKVYLAENDLLIRELI